MIGLEAYTLLREHSASPWIRLSRRRSWITFIS